MQDDAAVDAGLVGDAPLTPQQVQGLKHFKTLLPLFHQLHEVGCARDKAGNRTVRTRIIRSLCVMFGG